MQEIFTVGSTDNVWPNGVEQTTTIYYVLLAVKAFLAHLIIIVMESVAFRKDVQVVVVLKLLVHLTVVVTAVAVRMENVTATTEVKHVKL